MRKTHNALILSLFVVSMSFAGVINAEVQNQNIDASCAEDICLNAAGEQVACDSEATEANDDGRYCFHWGWRYNGHRGWHRHNGHHHPHHRR